jgi:hypothetical protein
MPDWIAAPICLIALAGFIDFAFRQGLSVKPDSEVVTTGHDTAAHVDVDRDKMHAQCVGHQGKVDICSAGGPFIHTGKRCRECGSQRASERPMGGDRVASLMKGGVDKIGLSA